MLLKSLLLGICRRDVAGCGYPEKKKHQKASVIRVSKDGRGVPRARRRAKRGCFIKEGEKRGLMACRDRGVVRRTSSRSDRRRGERQHFVGIGATDRVSQWERREKGARL